MFLIQFYDCGKGITIELGCDEQVNIGSGNGLVPNGTKPFPEPMLIKIHDTMASPGLNGLMYTHIFTSSGKHFRIFLSCWTQHGMDLFGHTTADSP